MVGDVPEVVNIRSKREIKKIRESGRIVYETLSALEQQIIVGLNGKELDKFAENFIRSQGAKPAFKGYMGYPSSLCISMNDEVVHGIPDNREFNEGDIITIDGSTGRIIEGNVSTIKPEISENHFCVPAVPLFKYEDVALPLLCGNFEA